MPDERPNRPELTYCGCEEWNPCPTHSGQLLCGWPYPGGALCKVPAPCPTHSGLVFGVGRYPSRYGYAYALVDEIQAAELGGYQLELTPLGLAVEMLGRIAADSQSAERRTALSGLRKVRARQLEGGDG